MIAVDDADAAGLRHGDGERAFGHRIHRRRDQRNAELDSRVRRVRVSVSSGRTAEAAGTSKTSSKVSACRISMRASRSRLALAYTGRGRVKGSASSADQPCRHLASLRAMRRRGSPVATT